jgi:CBS domain-containing protein
MTSTLHDRPSATWTPRTDRGDAAYESTLRFLQRVTHEHDYPPAPPSGPEFVRDVMTTSVVAAHEGAVFKELVTSLARNRVSAVPVIDAERRVIGVVSEADLLGHLAQVTPRPPRGHLFASHGEHQRKLYGTIAAQLMTSPAVVATPDMSIDDAAWLAARTRVKRLPVIDDNGILVGIVSRSDLLRPYLRPDAEIKADIVENVVHGAYILDRDELVVAVDEGVVSVCGQVPTRALAEHLTASIRRLAGVVAVDASALTYPTD